MTARYSDAMAQDQSVPKLWLLSDARNDAMLETALAQLPRRSGFVFRHYHLPERERADRFATLLGEARARDHVVLVSCGASLPGADRADGVYGSAQAIAASRQRLRYATAHDANEIDAAQAAGAAAIFLSPVFATRSHPGGATLGPLGFGVLAQRARVPVIALGGMTLDRATWLDWPRWAAIDGLA